MSKDFDISVRSTFSVRHSVHELVHLEQFGGLVVADHAGALGQDGVLEGCHQHTALKM